MAKPKLKSTEKTILAEARPGTGRREIRAVFNENAWAAVGKLAPGMDVFGFSKGQFSVMNLIAAVLDQTGPAHLTVSTWTAAKKEITTAGRLFKSNAILSLRWLVDFSFPRRQPAFAAMLAEKFGKDCIRVTANHAKFILFRNAEWDVVIRTSMNLNSNPRFEYFELSVDRDLVEFFERVVDTVFDNATPDEMFGERPSYHRDKFSAFGIELKALDDDDAERLGACLDDPAKSGLEIV